MSGDEARERELLLQLVSLEDGLDRLLRALATEELCGKAASVVSRFALVKRRVDSALEREGVVRVDSLGRPANTEFHEVVELRSDPSPAGTILDVELEAFLYKGSVLRIGRVTVSDGDGNPSGDAPL